MQTSVEELGQALAGFDGWRLKLHDEPEINDRSRLCRKYTVAGREWSGA
jgi:hypothetical protein